MLEEVEARRLVNRENELSRVGSVPRVKAGQMGRRTTDATSKGNVRNVASCIALSSAVGMSNEEQVTM